MLIKNFYTIQHFSKADNKVEAAVLLNPDHDVYKGHFPGQPVVPGVIQIQILRELAEKALGQKLFISEVTSAKYLNMIVPGHKPVLIEITLKPAETGFKLNGLIKNITTVYSKIKMVVLER